MLLAFSVHPSDEFLEEYAFRRLAEEQLIPLEAHLLVCPACHHALVEIYFGDRESHPGRRRGHRG
jgi:hypothetical protein